MPAGPPPTTQHCVEAGVDPLPSVIGAPRGAVARAGLCAVPARANLRRPPTLRHRIEPRASMGWHGHLQLSYRRANGSTVLLDRHEGPLRVLQSLYPEGLAVC